MLQIIKILIFQNGISYKFIFNTLKIVQKITKVEECTFTTTPWNNILDISIVKIRKYLYFTEWHDIEIICIYSIIFCWLIKWSNSRSRYSLWILLNLFTLKLLQLLPPRQYYIICKCVLKYWIKFNHVILL